MSDMSDSNEDDVQLEEEQLIYRCQQLHQQFLDSGKDTIITNVNSLFKELQSANVKITGI